MIYIYIYINIRSEASPTARNPQQRLGPTLDEPGSRRETYWEEFGSPESILPELLAKLVS